MYSPVFGVEIKEPTPEEKALIALVVKYLPVAVFQELNKSFNARGMVIAIDYLPVPEVKSGLEGNQDTPKEE